MRKWNIYLIIGVLIWLVNRKIKIPNVFLDITVFSIGLIFVVYGLIIFFKEKNKHKS